MILVTAALEGSQIAKFFLKHKSVKSEQPRDKLPAIV